MIRNVTCECSKLFRMFKTSQDNIGKQSISNDGVLAVIDEDKEIAWKSYHEKLLNTKFTSHGNSLPHPDTDTNFKQFLYLSVLPLGLFCLMFFWTLY